ncbi:MAG: DUF5680 domain-containing protein [Actinomyces sp.]|jgi:hypothetical protein|nr:DUF5680 domain-containing protein [Actinomyces sp.]MCI1788126.1 DUF5680 domain-containing protein [Actinomyces sp.]MCI1830273.1 DUF5680 domain-containing protein [Actinomyces sp.]MCI1867057.1 DUF5680 domain-containing protein [Actinomyces sp.]
MTSVDIDGLRRFLVRAKRATYADPGAAQAPPLRPGSHDYDYGDGPWIYRDTYIGQLRFIGEEVVHRREQSGDERPVWAMNYLGVSLVPETAAEVYERVLSPALLDPDAAVPVRGPAVLDVGDWRYTFTAQGDLAQFSGEERILAGGRLVYRLLCHGGLVV